MILVTGAGGKTGQAVIRALAGANMEVRAFVYRAEQRAIVSAAGARQTIVGDMSNVTALTSAAQGARAIYHICPNMHRAEVSIGRAMIEAAQAAGIAQVVYHSVLHPQAEAMPHHWNKLRVEEMLFEAQLNVTVLQPAAYMQNVLANWQEIAEEGIFRVPYAVATRLSMVDLDDVAQVVASVLADETHSGATYELAAAQTLSQSEIAEILSEVLMRPVQAVQIPVDEWQRNAQAAGLSTHKIDMLVKMFGYYDSSGLRGNANVLQWLLGHPPTDFRTFAARYA